MASDRPAASKTDSPLSFMQSLSPTTSYYEPDTSGAKTSSRSNDPELIVVLAWFAARDVHIAKYVDRHRELFPCSRILLVRLPVTNLFLLWRAKGDIEIARSMLRSVTDGDAGGHQHQTKPRVLLHVFSNGGMTTAARLYKMLGEPSLMPRHVLLLDSCPGYFHWMRTHLALSQALPWFFSPLAHFFMAVTWLLRAPLGKPPPIDENARAINAVELATREARRTYLYGTDDEMVDWRDVEDHAARARSHGFVVRMEKFVGGKHVAHVRVDGERYWRAVRETWDARMIK